MKPDMILHSDTLDILFEHRNKAYGAYDLRRNYQRRLVYALTGMFVLVLMFFVFNYFLDHAKPAHAAASLGSDKDIILDQFNLPPPQVPKPPVRTQKPVAEIRNTKPLIVPPNVKVDPPPPIDVLAKEDALIGTRNIIGEAPVSISTSPLPSGDGKTGENVEPAHDDDKPLRFAERMPEYPGGLEALRRFLGRNLQVPEGLLEAGQQVKVPVRFVINRDGVLTNVEFLVQADEGFKKEILRVLNKMPKWIPGSQNGRIVPVYLSIPIIFQATE